MHCDGWRSFCAGLVRCWRRRPQAQQQAGRTSVTFIPPADSRAPRSSVSRRAVPRRRQPTCTSPAAACRPRSSSMTASRSGTEQISCASTRRAVANTQGRRQADAKIETTECADAKPTSRGRPAIDALKQKMSARIGSAAADGNPAIAESLPSWRSRWRPTPCPASGELRLDTRRRPVQPADVLRRPVARVLRTAAEDHHRAEGAMAKNRGTARSRRPRRGHATIDAAGRASTARSCPAASTATGSTRRKGQQLVDRRQRAGADPLSCRRRARLVPGHAGHVRRRRARSWPTTTISVSTPTRCCTT